MRKKTNEFAKLITEVKREKKDKPKKYK